MINHRHIVFIFQIKKSLLLRRYQTAFLISSPQAELVLHYRSATSLINILSHQKSSIVKLIKGRMRVHISMTHDKVLVNIKVWRAENYLWLRNLFQIHQTKVPHSKWIQGDQPILGWIYWLYIHHRANQMG